MLSLRTTGQQTYCLYGSLKTLREECFTSYILHRLYIFISLCLNVYIYIYINAINASIASVNCLVVKIVIYVFDGLHCCFHLIDVWVCFLCCDWQVDLDFTLVCLCVWDRSLVTTTNNFESQLHTPYLPTSHTSCLRMLNITNFTFNHIKTRPKSVTRSPHMHTLSMWNAFHLEKMPWHMSTVDCSSKGFAIY